MTEPRADTPLRATAQSLVIRSAARRWVQRAAPYLFLGLLLCVFFWPTVLLRKPLSPADMLLAYYPWSGIAPPSFTAGKNPLRSDEAILYYPRRWSLVQDLQNGRFSVWQDDYLSGYRRTFANDFIGMFAFPPSWLFFLLPFTLANDLFHISIPLFAMLFMYRFLKEERLGMWPSILGALLYGFNGHLIIWLTAFPLSAIFALTPLALLFTAKLERTSNQWFALGLAITLAVQMYLAYIPAWLISHWFLALFILVKLISQLRTRHWRTTLVHVMWYGVAGIAALGLAAFALMPTLSDTFASSYLRNRTTGLDARPLEHVASLVFPNIWGNPTRTAWLGSGGNFAEWVGYFGVTAVPFALAGLALRWRHSLTCYAVAVGTLCGGMVYGIWPVTLFREVPGIVQIATGRWFIGFGLAASILAAQGLEALLTLGTPGGRFRAPALLVASTAGLIGLGTVAVYSGLRGSAALPGTTAGYWLPDMATILRETPFLTLSFCWQIVLALAAFSLVLGWLIRKRPLNQRLLSIVAVSMVFVDLFSFGHGFNPAIDRSQLYPSTPGIRFLQERSEASWGRVAPLSWVFPGYTANLYNLPVITGFDFYRDERYLNALSAMMTEQDRAFAYGTGFLVLNPALPPHQPVLSLLGARYVVAEPGWGLTVDGGNLEAVQPFSPAADTLNVGQSVVVGKPGFSGISVLMAAPGQAVTRSDVTFALYEGTPGGRLIYSETVEDVTIRDGVWMTFAFPPIPNSAGSAYYFELTAREEGQGLTPTVWMSSTDRYSDGTLYALGQPVDGDMVFRLGYQDPELAWLHRIYSGPDVWIYENPAALPLAWGVAEYDVVPSSTSLARLLGGRFDPRMEVLLEEQPDLPGEGTQQRPQVEMLNSAPGEIHVHTRSSGPGFVVFNRRYDEGWKATVDGNPSPVYRADYLLTAVAVPDGEHEVVVTYAPDDFRLGLLISAATATGIVLVSALLLITREVQARRRRVTHNHT